MKLRKLLLAAIIPATMVGLAACSDSDDASEDTSTETSEDAGAASDSSGTTTEETGIASPSSENDSNMATDVGSGDGSTNGAGSSNPGVETDGGESDPATGETQPSSN